MPITDYYTTTEKLTKTESANGRGGYTYAWATSLTFDALINQASSREVEMALKMGIEADYKMFYSVAVSLCREDRIKQSGVIYRVVSEPKNTVNRNHHHKVYLKRMDTDG